MGEYLVLKDVSKSFGKVHAVRDLSLEVQKGEFVSLLGPSGCGKTTVLRLIAGLEKPDKGIIKIGEKILSGHGYWVPPEKRRIGLVFQDYALFPHMTVFENVAFGLAGLSKKERQERVIELLSLVGLEHVAKRYPSELSGGQKQRVALARALAPSPEVMLLDEPFSNLDADLRKDLREETRAILKRSGTTTILVTHDQEEALSLSDRVGVLCCGKLEQMGTPEEIYHRPMTRFVAKFVGRGSIIAGKVEKGRLVLPFGDVDLNGRAPPIGERLEVLIRPEYVSLLPDPQGEGVIVSAEFMGSEVFYEVELPDGTILQSAMLSTVVFSVGTRVRLRVDKKQVVILP